ncbi:MAG: Signal peptidase I [uncultured Acidimicrobiales bacterium]|uniref:Signal peptidase I n=1 Tax=uncultured Acidimicrobiales bacterium TaxID=310071 RepID=A0A6J4H8I5_9ACTN|nr:MAG: Signal peptidase I [uncultured Acidimicrobiales bacterium]
MSGPALASEVVDSDRERWTFVAFVREIAVLVVTALVIAVVVKTFVAQAFYIPSGSMLPQLQINDRVVVSKVSYRLHDPRRGDIVVFDAPGDEQEDTSPLLEQAFRSVIQSIGLSPPSTDEYIKRVVALPGERVEGHQGKVLVDGLELVEPYLPPGVATNDFPAVVVPPETVFVMGDNRSNSSDSRIFGPVPRSTVVGRAFARVWPLDHTSFL